MRIPTLLDKIRDLAAQPEQRSAIDVDLMLDYTRVLYADLLEWRSRLPANTIPSAQPAVQPIPPAAPKPAEAVSSASIPKAAPEPEVLARPSPVSAPEKPEPMPVVPPPAPRHAPASDVRSLIGINDKYQIMSELFGNDKAAYEQALDFINNSRSESAAMAWLREHLWIAEERSDAAQSFFELVSRHFSR